MFHILLLTTYVAYVTFSLGMEEPETNNVKMQAGTNLEPAIYSAVEKLRVEEDRSMSNMIERLLKTHPRVQTILQSSEAATA